MEHLLRVVTVRNGLIAGIIIGALAMIDFFDLYQYAGQWVQSRLYPAQKNSGLAGREILQSKENRESAAVLRRYGKILDQLGAARREGFEIAPLAAKARAALKFNVAGYRIYATRLLIEVQMAVPRKQPRAAPVSRSDEDLEIPPNVPTKKTASKRL